MLHKATTNSEIKGKRKKASESNIWSRHGDAMGDVVINIRMPWVCFVINERWRQNVVGTSVTNSTAPCCYHFCFYKHFDVICELLPNRHVATPICQVAIYSLLSKFSLWRLRKEGGGVDRWKEHFFSTPPPLPLL